MWKDWGQVYTLDRSSLLSILLASRRRALPTPSLDQKGVKIARSLQLHGWPVVKFDFLGTCGVFDMYCQMISFRLQNLCDDNMGHRQIPQTP